MGPTPTPTPLPVPLTPVSGVEEAGVREELAGLIDVHRAVRGACLCGLGLGLGLGSGLGLGFGLGLG